MPELQRFVQAAAEVNLKQHLIQDQAVQTQHQKAYKEVQRAVVSAFGSGAQAENTRNGKTKVRDQLRSAQGHSVLHCQPRPEKETQRSPGKAGQSRNIVALGRLHLR